MRRWKRQLAAVALAGSMLLTGCSSGGGNENMATDDLASGPRPDGAPPAGPEGVPEAAQERGSKQGEQAEGGDRPVRPDYLSTFALDVDTASYGYARSTIEDGRLPEARTVRPEEFVNSFRQGYPQPEGDGFSVTADGARAGSDGWSLMRVGLATRQESEDAAERRAPAALTFVIDVSGSMAEPGRLDLVKQSLRTMVGQLRGEDSIALVTFSGEARTVLPMTRLGGEGQRADIRATIDDLGPRDSTNLGAGMETGYRAAVEGRREGATNRVVLLSDALANTGDTRADTILEKIGHHRREYGISLFGVGVGSSYGDALMERLTNKGDGHTVYVSSREDAEEVFVDQLPRNIALRARDAKAQVAFDRSNVEDFRLIGYDNRRVADEDFRDDRVDGGEIGPGHTVTALYAVRLAEGAEGRVATATVRWQDPGSREPHEAERTVDAEALRGELWDEDTAPRLRLTVVAAYFAEALRSAGGSYPPGDPVISPGPAERGGSDRAPEHGSEPRPGATRGPSGSLPGEPSLAVLAERARTVASHTEDKAVTRLAETIEAADRLTG